MRLTRLFVSLFFIIGATPLSFAANSHEIFKYVSNHYDVEHLANLHSRSSSKYVSPYYYEMRSYCLEKMIQMLDLSPTQAIQIVQIYENILPSLNLTVANSFEDKPIDQSSQLIKRLSLESETKILVLLTSDQQSQFPHFKQYRQDVVRHALAEKKSIELSQNAGVMPLVRQDKLRDMLYDYYSQNSLKPDAYPEEKLILDIQSEFKNDSTKPQIQSGKMKPNDYSAKYFLIY